MSKCFNIPKTQGISKHGKLTLKYICNDELVDELKDFDPTKGDIEFVVIHEGEDKGGGKPPDLTDLDAIKREIAKLKIDVEELKKIKAKITYMQ